MNGAGNFFIVLLMYGACIMTLMSLVIFVLSGLANLEKVLNIGRRLLLRYTLGIVNRC